MLRTLLEQTWLWIAALFAPFVWMTILAAIFAGGS